MEHTRLAVQRAIRGETGRGGLGFAGNAIFSGKMITDVRRFRKPIRMQKSPFRNRSPETGSVIPAGHIDVGYTPDNSTTADPADCEGAENRKLGMIIAIVTIIPLAIHPHLSVEMLAGHPLVLYERMTPMKNLTTPCAAARGWFFAWHIVQTVR